jgi:Flp pilus assembly protein TadG
MMRKDWLRRWRNEESGQSMVETALSFIIIFILVFWIFEISLVMYTYVVLGDAAQEGVRFAVVKSGVTTDDPAVIARVQRFAQLSLHNVSAMTVNVELPDGNATPPSRVRVKVTYTFVPYFRNLIGTAPVMRTYAEGRMIVGST